MFQQFNSVQDYYRAQARANAERRRGEDRRKRASACLAAWRDGERREAERRA